MLNQRSTGENRNKLIGRRMFFLACAKVIVFTGIVDQSNVFKIYLKNDGIWTSMLDNVSGISCIYFSGMPGMLDSPKSSKKNTKVKIWE